MKYQSIIFLLFFSAYIHAATVVVNGGQVTINGAVTDTQIDIMVNYTANVKWLAVIFSKDEVNTDIHVLQVDETNAANPVKVNDCYLDELGNIMPDDVKNIQPSITTFTSSIVPYGMKVAYNRDLFTGDLEDKRFYPDDVIQICFMSSLAAFQGGGYQQGNEKICTFFSLHKSVDYYQDRLLGNFAATTLFGGSNLTVYASQSTDEGTPEPWLFLAFVHKQQGLTPYYGKWLGITYEDSLDETDLTVVEYAYRDYTTQVHILDMYATDSTTAKKDLDYVQLQGGDDIIENLGALDQNGYMVAQYKRKFQTGDVNRDTQIVEGQNTFCFILGDDLAYTSFVQQQRTCLTFMLAIPYTSYFRVKEEVVSEQVEYVQPESTVEVVKVVEEESEQIIKAALLFSMLLALLL